MDRTIVGLFDDLDTAQRVIEELTQNGFTRDQISLVANERPSTDGGDKVADTMTVDTTASATDGAAAGAGIGAVLGGLAGLLVGIGALAIPGIGPIIAAGPLAAALAGAGLGAATGGVIGALVDAGVPEEEARYYAEGVRRGGVLLTVRTNEDLMDRGIAILHRYSPADMDQRVAAWREHGETGFDMDEVDLLAREYSDTTYTSGTAGGFVSGVTEQERVAASERAAVHDESLGQHDLDLERSTAATSGGSGLVGTTATDGGTGYVETQRTGTGSGMTGSGSGALGSGAGYSGTTRDLHSDEVRDTAAGASANSGVVSGSGSDSGAILTGRDVPGGVNQVGVSGSFSGSSRTEIGSAGMDQGSGGGSHTGIASPIDTGNRGTAGGSFSGNPDQTSYGTGTGGAVAGGSGAGRYTEASLGVSTSGSYPGIRQGGMVSSDAFDIDDDYYRQDYQRQYAHLGLGYERYQPAYRYGYDLANDERYRDRDWNNIEADARLDWQSRRPDSDWQDFKDAIRHGWNRVRGSVRDAFDPDR